MSRFKIVPLSDEDRRIFNKLFPFDDSRRAISEKWALLYTISTIIDAGIMINKIKASKRRADELRVENAS